MRTSERRVLPLAFIAAALGCSNYAVDGFMVNKGKYDSDSAEVRRLASYTLNCPADQLTLRVLGKQRDDFGSVGQFGVDGCGHRATYVRPHINTGWVQNTLQASQPAAP